MPDDSVRAGRFCSFSAGSHPKGEAHPLALQELEKYNYSTDDGLRGKDLDEFAVEVCPVWPGQAMTAHWGVADPVVVEGEDCVKQSASAAAFRELQNRISIFVNLPLASIDKPRPREKLDETGRIRLVDAEVPAA